MKTKAILILTTGTVALAACSSDPYGGIITEAGTYLSSEGYGEATRNNIGVQNGDIQYASDLNDRFNAEVPTTVNFAFNSAVLDAQARQVLSTQAAWIRQFPEVRFRVYGHTDAVGSTGYNQRLGQRRANAVVAFFASQGIGRERLEAAVSFGENQPLIVSQGREPLNRRAVVTISSE